MKSKKSCPKGGVVGNSSHRIRIQIKNKLFIYVILYVHGVLKQKRRRISPCKRVKILSHLLSKSIFTNARLLLDFLKSHIFRQVINRHQSFKYVVIIIKTQRPLIFTNGQTKAKKAKRKKKTAPGDCQIYWHKTQKTCLFLAI